MATVLHPGRLSPTRQVPAEIARPEYVGKKRPRTGEPDVKTPEIIERMRVAGKLAAQALAEVGAHVAPGVTTDYLDQVGHDFLVSHGAYPSTLGYRGYPKSLCTSLNEVICHGIPDDTLINDGDIVNIDITAFIGGVHGDTNATFCAGDVDSESRLLVERTHEAMMRGIRAVAPGRPLNAVGRVIESYARRFGYGVVRDFTGHGIGRTFHSGLIVPHYDDPHHPVAEPPGVRLDHPADGVQRAARSHRADAAHHRLVRPLDQQPRFLVDVTGQERRVGVPVHAADVRGDVNVDDVTVVDHRVVGDPVADHLVQRGTQRLRVAAVAERAGVGAVADQEVVAHLVQVVGRDAWGHSSPNCLQGLGGQLARHSHPLDDLGRLDVLLPGPWVLAAHVLRPRDVRGNLAGG